VSAIDLNVWLSLGCWIASIVIITDVLATRLKFKRTTDKRIEGPDPQLLGMSQSYHLPETSLSSNAPQTVPLGLAANTSQATTVDNPSTSDETQNLPAGADYPVHSSAGDGDAWTQDTQNEWMPGFGRMVGK
jgi:hypothetical protein